MINQKPDLGKIMAALNSAPLNPPQSDKGRFFNDTWWPKHYKEVEKPVLEMLMNEKESEFNRRCSVLEIARDVDNRNGKELRKMNFKQDEITRYVTRALNKRLKRLATDSGVYYVIRNQKLNPMALEHKPAA